MMYQQTEHEGEQKYHENHINHHYHATVLRDMSWRTSMLQASIFYRCGNAEERWVLGGEDDEDDDDAKKKKKKNPHRSHSCWWYINEREGKNGEKNKPREMMNIILWLLLLWIYDEYYRWEDNNERKRRTKPMCWFWKTDVPKV